MSIQHIFADIPTLTEALAQRWANLADAAIAERGRFSVALSGGRTPRALYALLASEAWRKRLPWAQTELYLGDERCVPADHPDSNARMVRETLLEHLETPPLFFPMVRRPAHPEQDAAHYGQLLRERLSEPLKAAPVCGRMPQRLRRTDYREFTSRQSALKKSRDGFFQYRQGDETAHAPPCFDLVLLGMGADGHFASLFPGTAASEDRESLVLPVWVEKLHAWRISLGRRVIAAARQRIVMVTGEDKRATLYEITRNPVSNLPIARLQQQAELEWYIDLAAAPGKLSDATT